MKNFTLYSILMLCISLIHPTYLYAANPNKLADYGNGKLIIENQTGFDRTVSLEKIEKMVVDGPQSIILSSGQSVTYTITQADILSRLFVRIDQDLYTEGVYLYRDGRIPLDKNFPVEFFARTLQDGPTSLFYNNPYRACFKVSIIPTGGTKLTYCDNNIRTQ